MNKWTKFCIYTGIRNNESSEEIDTFLHKNFIDNPNASFKGFSNGRYNLYVSNGKRIYSIWNSNRWYAWLSECVRTREKENGKIDDLTRDHVWRNLQPTRRGMIEFYEWLEKFPSFTHQIDLKEDEL